jgi:hypothetical protein
VVETALDSRVLRILVDQWLDAYGQVTGVTELGAGWSMAGRIRRSWRSWGEEMVITLGADENPNVVVIESWSSNSVPVIDYGKNLWNVRAVAELALRDPDPIG